MKKILLLLLLGKVLPVTAQNNFQLSFSAAQGNSSWRYSNLQFGNDNLQDTYANCPTIAGDISAGYRFNKISAGIGFSAQHFFLNEFTTEHFEGNNFLVPIYFTPYNDPQPTHFKFYLFMEYAFMKKNNLELFASFKAGTFLTRSMTPNSGEGFHWFLNIAAGLNYYLNEKVTFSISPVFDYSRVNLILFNDPERKEPYINIYSFYTSFSIKYNFAD